MDVETILKSKGNQTFTVEENAHVHSAALAFKRHAIGAVIVQDASSHVSGIFSERDLVAAIADFGAEALGRYVCDHMTRDVLTCRPDSTIDELMAMMTNRRIRHIPVIEGNQLVGLVSIGDIVKWRIAETEHEAEALRAYIATG